MHPGIWRLAQISSFIHESRIRVRGVRGLIVDYIFPPFYSAAVSQALRSTVISLCIALFMTQTAIVDCTTLAHAKREKEEELSLSLFNAGNKDVTSSA